MCTSVSLKTIFQTGVVAQSPSNDATSVDSAPRTNAGTCPAEPLVDKHKALCSSSWKIIQGGSRKKNDLLRDGQKNQYTKRSPTVWQCTKRVKLTKNRCPATVREENGRYKLEKGHCKHLINK